MDQAQIDFAAALIGRIDSGERNVFLDSVNTEKQIECKLFGEGVFFACLFEKGLRIHIAFETDTGEFNEEIAALVRGALKKTGGAACVIWLWNDNRKIIEYLKETFHITTERDYASIEFVMRRENFHPAPNETLEIRPYEPRRLFAYLNLLAHSMTFSGAPRYWRYVIHSARGFAKYAKNDAFEAFWKDGKLIGVYWRKTHVPEVNTIAVADGYQRRGYGTIILTRAIEMIFQHTDKECAYLYAVDWNVKGQSFYRKYGMEENGHSYCLHVENYRE
ncbi:MAG: GNAT family N-acetyltransferase [Oscillospiraceae bacterium]|jgi:ribosomal protein S18 acetylase RimI-like enzyme|nr:GNAT family N-acetyltransferase [Oscillospiraceae bacterium]